jgi:hypothetical protein
MEIIVEVSEMQEDAHPVSPTEANMATPSNGPSSRTGCQLPV